MLNIGINDFNIAYLRIVYFIYANSKYHTILIIMFVLLVVAAGVPVFETIIVPLKSIYA